MQVLLNNTPVSKISAEWEANLQKLKDYLKKTYPRVGEMELNIQIGVGNTFAFQITARDATQKQGYRPHVWSMGWKLTQTPACCAFPLLHTFNITSTDPSMFNTLAWMVQTMNAAYWMDQVRIEGELESWEYYDDDDDTIQHCMQLNLIENYYPFWHWFAKEFGAPEGSFEVYNHNSGNRVEVLVTRFS